MALSINAVSDRIAALKQRYAERDARMADVLAIRKGDISTIAGDMFPEGMSKPMIANFIDVVARDLAELLAPLPSVNCATTSMSDKEKEAAEKRTLIANNYIQYSNLETQMYTGADWWFTYGICPIVVEPDLDDKMPRIRIENPLGFYPDFDRYGRVVSYAKVYTKTLYELIVDFPEYETVLLEGQSRNYVDLGARLEIVYYQDKDQILLLIPSRKNLALIQANNPMGKVICRIALKPGIDPEDVRGQFDDIVWVQVARAQFANLAMEAAEKSVQAPIAVPSDVQEFAFGPDAIIRSQNPQAIRRVGLELPTGAFTEQSVLESEMRMGARYPEGRSGNINASIITGQGVQALLGGFDSQIKTGQTIFADALREIISLCFEMDEKLFDLEKEVSGFYQGAPYKMKYTPSRHIKGDYSVQVRYGLMSGLDPSRALIFSLQALQAGLVSRELIMHELPWQMNVTDVQKTIEIERMRDQLSGSFAAMSQAIPQMATNGQDPSAIITKIADVIQQRKNGVSIEDAVAKAFAQEAPPAPAAPQVSPAEMMPPVEQQSMTAAPEQSAPAGEPTSQPQAAPPDIATILGMMQGQ